MAAKLAGDARVKVGRPRKHAEGWNSCISLRKTRHHSYKGSCAADTWT